jgi:hypothetical protein
MFKGIKIILFKIKLNRIKLIQTSSIMLVVRKIQRIKVIKKIIKIKIEFKTHFIYQ